MCAGVSTSPEAIDGDGARTIVKGTNQNGSKGREIVKSEGIREEQRETEDEREIESKCEGVVMQWRGRDHERWL